MLLRVNTLILTFSSLAKNNFKITEIFIFTLFCGTSKGFMKAFTVFTKPFEVPQRRRKIKI